MNLKCDEILIVHLRTTQRREVVVHLQIIIIFILNLTLWFRASTFPHTLHCSTIRDAKRVSKDSNHYLINEWESVPSPQIRSHLRTQHEHSGNNWWNCFTRRVHVCVSLIWHKSLVSIRRCHSSQIKTSLTSFVARRDYSRASWLHSLLQSPSESSVHPMDRGIWSICLFAGEEPDESNIHIVQWPKDPVEHVTHKTKINSSLSYFSLHKTLVRGLWARGATPSINRYLPYLRASGRFAVTRPASSLNTGMWMETGWRRASNMGTMCLKPPTEMRWAIGHRHLEQITTTVDVHLY